jgi:hypothetical protein
MRASLAMISGIAFLALLLVACGGSSAGNVDAGADVADAGDTGTETDSGSDSGTDTDTTPDIDCTGVVFDTEGLAVDTDCAGKPDFWPCVVVTDPDRAYDVCSGGTCISPGCGDASCNAPRLDFRMSRTEGHAAELTRVQLTDPVVLDHATGLMWTGCELGRSGADCAVDGITWTIMTWPEAMAACDALDWAGFDDWRVPSRLEAVSLQLYDENYNLLFEALFPDSRPASFTSSTSASDDALYWNGSFAYPGMDQFDKASVVGYVQPVYCVRSDEVRLPQPLERRSYVPEEPVVLDRTQGLVWQGCPAGEWGEHCEHGQFVYGGSEYPSWMEAVCSESVYGGFADWRLPTVKELLAIVDDRYDNPAFDVDIWISNNHVFWSSSPTYTSFGLFWNVWGNHGYVQFDTAGMEAAFLCVRDLVECEKK